jgi:hypothetical protein
MCSWACLILPSTCPPASSPAYCDTPRHQIGYITDPSFSLFPPRYGEQNHDVRVGYAYIAKSAEALL